MKRNVSLDEISDGRLYGSNDMVKADCHGCKGCHRCCTGMGNSILVDPYDAYRLQKGLGKGMEALLAEETLELNMADGVILPNLKMVGAEERCAFLNKEGRCSVHDSRPGLCRIFPLGRFYENGDFKYFLQTGECGAKGRTKVKVSRWIDTPDQGRYHDFVLKWHELLKKVQEEMMSAVTKSAEEAAQDAMKGADVEVRAGTEESVGEAGIGPEENVGLTADMERAKESVTALLQIFYMDVYDTDRDFYEQFEERLLQFPLNVSKGCPSGRKRD